ncbi:MAG: OmpA family protein [Saprospiraceae bacterium]
MKNLLLPFLFLLLGAWIWGGSMLYTSTCCGGAISGLLVKDGANAIASSSSNFHFGQSGYQALGFAAVDDELKSTADYLIANPDRKLIVEGSYTADETNNSSFGNLGLARANNVISELRRYNAPVEQLEAGSKLMNGLAFSDNKTYDAIGWSFAETVRGISFNDPANNFKESFADNFQFAESKADYSTPLSPGLSVTIGKAAEYLKGHGDRAMLITGYYADGETNNSILPDLGLARANAIKKAFTDLNVPSNQINITSEKRALNFEGGIASAATYSYAGMDTSGDRLAEVEARLRAKPLVLYFETGKNNLNLSTAQRQYMADIIYYLDNKTGAKVNVVGHTDNKGNAGANVRLSQKRAEFAKDYLTRNNINAAKIDADGKGPNQPTATNDTAEGRAKNRRVELTIN